MLIRKWTEVDQMNRSELNGPPWNEMDLNRPNWTEMLH